MLAGYKTYITAALAILGAVASYFMGDLALADAIQIVIPALMGAFVRHGVTTTLNSPTL